MQPNQGQFEVYDLASCHNKLETMFVNIQQKCTICDFFFLAEELKVAKTLVWSQRGHVTVCLHRASAREDHAKDTNYIFTF